MTPADALLEILILFTYGGRISYPMCRDGYPQEPLTQISQKSHNEIICTFLPIPTMIGSLPASYLPHSYPKRRNPPVIQSREENSRESIYLHQTPPNIIPENAVHPSPVYPGSDLPQTRFNAHAHDHLPPHHPDSVRSTASHPRTPPHTPKDKYPACSSYCQPG